MAYDGIFIRSQIDDIKKNILNEKIGKIVQINDNVLDLLFRKNNKNIVFFISINPNFPFMTITNDKQYIGEYPPPFCMICRKYLSSGKIININQIDGHGNKNSLERIIDITIENTNIKGDITFFHLIIELLGRYSNIILTDNNYIIIDIIKKIPSTDKTLRILKPKSIYNTDELNKKTEIMNTDYNLFIENIKQTINYYKLNKEKIYFNTIILNTFYGLSKTFIEHIINISQLNTEELTYDKIENNNKIKYFYDNLINEIQNILNKKTKYYIFYENNKPKDFHATKLSIYNEKNVEFNNSFALLEQYLFQKQNFINENNIKTNLKNTINKLILKINKKIEINEKDIYNCEHYEKYKIYGELINTYGYNKKLNSNNELCVNNFYDNNKIINIPIDTTISMQQNATKYFNKYNKQKRTIEITNKLLSENKNILEHLISINDTLQYTNESDDLKIIQYEINKFFETNKKNIKDSKKNNNKNQSNLNNLNILHYKINNKYDIYVGKNNLQNDYVTFDIANKYDTWFHVKDKTGSHVVIKENYEKLDLDIIEKVASLAAYYSSAQNEKNVEVVYTLKKEIKKVKNKTPGFVIYHKYYSINVKPFDYFSNKS